MCLSFSSCAAVLQLCCAHDYMMMMMIRHGIAHLQMLQVIQRPLGVLSYSLQLGSACLKAAAAHVHAPEAPDKECAIAGCAAHGAW